MKLLDTHAHLDFPQYDDDRPALVEALRESSVGVINVGADLPSSAASLELARRHTHVLATCGVHPHEARKLDGAALERLEGLLSCGAVAVGECGLDFYRDRSPRPRQIEAFRAQLRLARKLDLPVVLHQREAWDTFLAVLREEGPVQGVVHAFSGGLAEAGEVVALGLHLGIGGPITYPKNNRLREAVRAVPLSRLLLETDAPYLPPQPFRGRRNDPLKVRLVAHELAELLSLSVEEIADRTWTSACALFEHAPSF